MALKKYLLLLVICSAINFKTLDAANILGVFPLNGRSHYQMFEAFMKGLAEKGHNVDVISHFPQKKPFPRFRDISMEGTLPLVVNNVSVTEAAHGGSIWQTLLMVFKVAGEDVCDALLNLPEIDQVYEDLRNKKYDVMITEIFGTDCALGLAADHGVPTVAMVSGGALPWAADRFGGIDNPSYIPNIFLPFDNQMSFFERLTNTYVHVVGKLLYYYKSTLVTESQILKKYPNTPSLESLQKNTSLLLVNGHYMIQDAHPVPPNIKEVAGLHVRPPGKLSEKFEKILNSSKKGVIFFTLGSMVRTESFTTSQKRALLDSFAELPDYTVIWKGDRTAFPEPIPKNVHFDTWLPQLEILCHPKTKVFLSHGGLMGTLEAISCGVPIIGLPIFGDQHSNVELIKKKGLGLGLNYHTLSKKEVLTAFKTVLEDPKYLNNAKEFANVFLDRPISAMEEAIFWVEYVIRHKGAPHLRPASVNIPWYQLYLFDIALFVLVLIIVVLMIAHFIISKIRTFLSVKRNPSQETKKLINKIKTK